MRVEWLSPGAISLGNGRPDQACVVSNLGNGGAKISRVDAYSIPDEFMLTLWPGKALPRKCRVKWRALGEIGVEFEEPFPTTSPGNKSERKRDPARPTD